MVSSLNSGQPGGGVRAAPPNPEVAYQAQLQQLTQVRTKKICLFTFKTMVT